MAVGFADDPRSAASVRARGAIDRGVVTDTLRRQTLATSASRGERPRAVVIVAKNLTGGAGKGRGDPEEHASSRDEDPLRRVRGTRTVEGSAKSRPRQSEHTTHLSQNFENAVQTEREKEKKKERYVREGGE